MTPRWDAVLREAAREFLASLPLGERRDCRQVILNDLCNNPLPANNPARRELLRQQGTIQCFIKGWHFLYGIENANTIRVYGIYYSPNNPSHPIFGLPSDSPELPDIR